MGKEKVISLPAIFNKMTPKKDKSWKFEIETRELSGEEVSIMADRLGTEGYWVNSPNPDIELADIPKGVAESGLEAKTPSKRLRSVLFLLWQQSGEPDDDFDRWYAGQMERLIDLIKSKLDD